MLSQFTNDFAAALRPPPLSCQAFEFMFCEVVVAFIIQNYITSSLAVDVLE